MYKGEGQALGVVVRGADSKEKVFLASGDEPDAVISGESVTLMDPRSKSPGLGRDEFHVRGEVSLELRGGLVIEESIRGIGPEGEAGEGHG